MAGTARLELVTSGVTDLHARPLIYRISTAYPRKRVIEYIIITPFGVRFGVHPQYRSAFISNHFF